MNDEVYGVDIESAHPRAKELISENFFWDCSDELAPFGSDEGDTALAEYRDWKKENPKSPLKECIIWTIESVSEQLISKYTNEILSKAKIQEQISDHEYDDQQYVYTVDISVIATGFGQLLDEGYIEADSKPYIAIAISRQKLWAKLQPEWPHSSEYIANLIVLERALEQA